MISCFNNVEQSNSLHEAENSTVQKSLTSQILRLSGTHKPATGVYPDVEKFNPHISALF